MCIRDRSVCVEVRSAGDLPYAGILPVRTARQDPRHLDDIGLALHRNHRDTRIGNGLTASGAPFRRHTLHIGRISAGPPPQSLTAQIGTARPASVDDKTVVDTRLRVN